MNCKNSIIPEILQKGKIQPYSNAIQDAIDEIVENNLPSVKDVLTERMITDSLFESVKSQTKRQKKQVPNEKSKEKSGEE